MELKPCPFCGREAKIIRIGDIYGVCHQSLRDCPVEPLKVGWRTEHEVAAIWNTRAAEIVPQIDGLIDALRDDWNIEVSWDGLRKFWYVGLTEDGVRKRDERDRAERTCRIKEDADTGCFLTCSECGAIQPEDYTVYYCWNCGAKVVE